MATSGEFFIPDVEGPVRRELLAYMNTLQAPQESSSFAQLLSAADKYGLSGLKAECEQRLAKELTVESAAATAVLAVRHNCPTLRQAAVAFIRNHSVHVMGTVGWADAIRKQSEDLIEVSRLVAEPLAEIRSLPQVEKDRRLIKAAKEGRMELQTLLAAGADVNARDEKEWTALHWVADRGHVDAARCLLDSGAHVDARTSTQFTPLHFAAGEGRTAVVELLLESSADYNAKDAIGYTPLHWAAFNNRRDAAAALLHVGADKEARDDEGQTPLMLALEEDCPEVIEILN